MVAHADMVMSMSDMPSPTASSSMSGMSMDHGMMGMESMMMTFFSATNTPLYSSSWIPNTAGQYVGTCVFLVALGFLFRCLLAIRYNFLPLLAWATHRRDTNVLCTDQDEKKAFRAFPSAERRAWRINEALLRACLDTILAGVSYLL